MSKLDPSKLSFAEICERLGRNSAEIAAIQRRVTELRTEIHSDASLHELARAWAHHEAGVDVRMVGDKYFGLPEGWPAAVTDTEVYIEKFIDARLSTRAPEHEPAREDSPGGPLLVRLRGLLNTGLDPILQPQPKEE